MHRSSLKYLLTQQLKLVCDNVESVFSHPKARAEENGSFPYVTMVWKTFTPDNLGVTYGVQTVDIIGFVKGEDEDLIELSSALETKITAILYKNEFVKNNIIMIDSSNLFQPYGLNAGVYPPFAGFRIELQIGNVILDGDISLENMDKLKSIAIRHGDLVGLQEDDHQQYYNDARLSDVLYDYALKTELHEPVTVTGSSEIDLSINNQEITASIKISSIDETKLSESVNDRLDLANTAIQEETDPLSLHLNQTVTQKFIGGSEIDGKDLNTIIGDTKNFAIAMATAL